MPMAKIGTATTAPAASQLPNARIAVASTIRLAMGFPLPFTIDLLPDTVHQLRELTCREPRLTTKLHQLPRPLDDALIVAIDERRLALLRLDERSQPALKAEQSLLLQIAIHASHRVCVDAERDGELAHGRERVAGAERAAADEQPDLLGQLHVDRKRARAIDLEPPWHGARVAE